MSVHFLDITVEEYHEHPGIGSGALRTFIMTGPLEYYACHVAKKKESESDAFRLGRAFHAAMETPGTWTDRYIRVPIAIDDADVASDIEATFKAAGSKAAIPGFGEELNLRRPFDRAYRDHFRLVAERECKDYLNGDEIDTVHKQVAAVWDNPAIRDILSVPGKAEVAAVRQVGGLVVKALLDVYQRERFIDFKTTKAKSPSEFWREAKRHGYDWQIAHYSIVTGQNVHKLVYVSKEYPFEAQLVDMPTEWIADKKDAIEYHLGCLNQLYEQLDDNPEVDSDGIPLIFHNEPWGAEIDPIAMFESGDLQQFLE